MAYVDGYDLHRMRETGRGAPSSDPNMMAWTTKYQAEWGGGKRELGQAVQKRLNAMEDARWPPRPTTKLCPPPQPIQPREGVNAGMRHYGPTESTYTELPLSIPGLNKPMLYFGGWRSSFCLHTEDSELGGLSFLHQGAPKFWYVVPSDP